MNNFVSLYVPVRRAITRRGHGYRVKVVSRKAGRAVHCESMLEADAVRILDLHPQVVSIEEQPVCINFRDSFLQMRSAVPDFRLGLSSDVPMLLEVKWHKHRHRTAIARKLQSLAEHLDRAGQPYRVWTEEDIRREPRFSTVRKIRRRAKQRLLPREQEALFQQLGSCDGKSFGQLAQSVTEDSVYRLLLASALFVDLNEPLTDESKVQPLPFKGGLNDQI